MSTTLCTGGTGGKRVCASIGLGLSGWTNWFTSVCKFPNGGTPSRAATPDTPPAPRVSTANSPVRFRLGFFSLELGLTNRRATNRRTLI